MEEIKYKLNSNNVMIVTEAISLLLNSIMKSTKEGKNSGTLEQYFNLLHEQCVSSNAIVSSAACCGFLKLLHDGLLEINSSLSSTMAMVLSVDNFTGIVSIISGILTESVLRDVQANSVYECRWRIIDPMHPFVLIIEQRRESVKEVIEKMDTMCSTSSSVHEHALELLRPVFVWILCSKHKPYTLLDQYNSFSTVLSFDYSQEQFSLIVECLVWQEISQATAKSVFQLYSLLAKWTDRKNEEDLLQNLLPNFAIIAHVLILNGDDPRECFRIMQNLLKPSIDNFIVACTLGLLAETVLVCPALYMSELLSLCFISCEINHCILTDYMLVSAVLQWDYNKNFLTQNFDIMLRNILNVVTNKCYKECTEPKDNVVLDIFKSINGKIFKIFELCANYERTNKSQPVFDSWIEKCKFNDDSNLKCEYLLFFQSLLLLPSKVIDDYKKVKVFEVIMELVSAQPDIATGQLPITLYCLKSSQSSCLTIELLKGIPKLALLKENIPIVIGILKNITNLPNSFVIELYTILFKYQHRCYPYLQTVLAENLCQVQDKNIKWEILVAQAKAVEYICQTSAESRGMELVPIVSELIGQSQKEECTVAICLSLEAIKLLWKAETIDPVSAWQVLAPKFHREKCENIKIKICDLLGTVPLLQRDTSDYDDFVDKVIAKLWQFTDDSHSEVTNIAAYRALSNYQINMLTLKQFPDKYKTGVVIPSNVLKIGIDEKQKPDDVLDHIPSIVWANLFKYTRSGTLPGVVEFCYSLMSREISAYRSGVYNVVSVELDSAKYLPNASVVRGLLEFLRKESMNISTKTIDPALMKCINCLNMPFEKPLPPLNWSFLSNLIHNSNLILTLEERKSVMEMLAKLSESSPSALKLLLTYVELSDGVYEEDNMLVLCAILPSICKSAKPALIMPIVEDLFRLRMTVIQSWNTSDGNSYEKSRDYKLCEELLHATSKCLQDENISTGIKNSFSKFLLDMWNSIECCNVVWPEVVRACCSLTYEIKMKLVQPMSEKACYLSSKLAADDSFENPLNWLNHFIDNGIDNVKERPLIFSTVIPILMNTKADLDCTRNWLLKLKMRAQVQMLKDAATPDSICFLLDIVMTSVIIFSQHCISSFYNESVASREKLQSQTFKMFPQAFGNLFKKSDEWKTVGCQLLEWLHFCRKSELIDESYMKIINKAVAASLYSPNFENQHLWAKYVSPKLNFV